MLTYEDCVGLSELTEGEIEAIAEHEHIPEIAALEMGNYLVHTPAGERRLKTFIADDLALARVSGNQQHAALLRAVLKNFVAQHHLGARRTAP